MLIEITHKRSMKFLSVSTGPGKWFPTAVAETFSKLYIRPQFSIQPTCNFASLLLKFNWKVVCFISNLEDATLQTFASFFLSMRPTHADLKTQTKCQSRYPQEEQPILPLKERCKFFSLEKNLHSFFQCSCRQQCFFFWRSFAIFRQRNWEILEVFLIPVQIRQSLLIFC